ncbi:glycosyltransferase [Ilumatobacter sp.]|uniref:glycosyltransferase n=1 Tax=Ilumatobacter sp. TaxID=1967498 RepID=UPI003C6FFE48
MANRDLPAADRSASVVVAVTGLDTIFGDAVPTYSTADELESQIRVLLSDAPLRRRLAAAGREIVLAQHTLDHRAAQWLSLLDAV